MAVATQPVRVSVVVVVLVAALAVLLAVGIVTSELDARIAAIPTSCTGHCHDGANGLNATVALGATDTLTPGANNSVVNAGPSVNNVVLDFALAEGERGTPGVTGDNASIDVTVMVNDTLSGQYTSTEMNITIDAENRTLIFTGATGLRGEDATVEVGSVVTLGHTVMNVTNVGNGTHAVYDFVLPRALTGASASVSVGTVATGVPGTNASVQNTGNASDAVYAFVLPAGDAGTNASIAVGTVSVDTTASINNVGNGTKAIYDFVVPVGAATGQPGDNGNVSVTTEVNGVVTNSSTFDTGSLELTVIVAQNITITNVTGPIGEAGLAPTISFLNTTQLPTGSPATVSNAGTSSALLLDMGAPRGASGLATSIAVGNTSVLAVGANATVTNAGDANDVILELGLPQGQQGNAATCAVANTTILASGAVPSVTNAGNATAVLLDFGIPQGLQGTAGTVSCVAGTTTSSAPGGAGSVTNVGTPQAAILNVVTPTGATAGVTIGTTTTGSVATSPSSSAAVTNSGTSASPVLNFVLPQSQLTTGQQKSNINHGGTGSLPANTWSAYNPWALSSFLTSNMAVVAGLLKYSGPGTTAIITMQTSVSSNSTPARVLFRITNCPTLIVGVDFTSSNTTLYQPVTVTCVAQIVNGTTIGTQLFPNVGIQVFGLANAFLTVFSRLR